MNPLQIRNGTVTVCREGPHRRESGDLLKQEEKRSFELREHGYLFAEKRLQREIAAAVFPFRLRNDESYLIDARS